ncbi:MAG: bidirectional hydrogenase complex protein HoxU [Candidatus Acetothermia bacterium]|nr:bidirectional hydrogenase complex protein HoxU [Candidatus Acetothermia bacterium]
MIALRIDDIPVQAEPGQTILDAAKAAGIRIPTLCHLPGLSPVGACRLCLVEIRNWNGKLVPACATPVQEGLDVVANSDRLRELRRTILELLFAERNHICAFCVANGHCELQDLAAELGMDHVRFPYRFPPLPLDASHAKFGIDHNRCILCGRCVRACSEVEGAMTWGFAGRGIFTLVAADLGDPWGDSKTCTGCGKCVQACPTGALFEKGRATGEQEKRPAIVAALTERRPRAQG